MKNAWALAREKADSQHRDNESAWITARIETESKYITIDETGALHWMYNDSDDAEVE